VPTLFTYVAPHADHAHPTVAVQALPFVLLLTGWRTTLPREVRAHSPPRLTDAPLRAPPLVTPI
jgi:hypothetical protein